MFTKQFLRFFVQPPLLSKANHFNLSYNSFELIIKASTAQLCPPSLHRRLHWSTSIEKLSHQEEVIDTTTEDKQVTKDVIARVNAQLEQQTQGRLFAVVHAGGKQFKVTPEDIIIVEGYWPPQFGDIITLDKVLLVGASDFTLIGRPILSPELVCVSATVIEKSLSHIKTHFRKKKRKQYMRINFHRTPFTMLRINSIDLKGCVNQKKDVEGIAGRVF